MTMKLLFLGTGSAKCKKLHEDQIPEGARRCSSMLMDGTVQLDVPIHTYDFLEKHGISPASVTDIFLTHSHDDHFCKDTFLRYAKAGGRKLNFYCNTGAVECLELTEEELSLINLVTVEPMQTFEAAGMTVTALPSNHIAGKNEQTLHYVFEKNGQKLFYGLDGGWLTGKEWSYLYRTAKPVDCAIFDTTCGEQPGNFRIGTHNTIPMVRLLVEAFKENGVIKEGGTFLATHIGPHIHAVPAEETARILAEFGVTMAYDGFEIEI